MATGVWFPEEIEGVLQALAMTNLETAARAGEESGSEATRAYVAGYQAALVAVGRALGVLGPVRRGGNSVEFLDQVHGPDRTKRRNDAFT
jgi:hypothetical protein